MDRRIELIEEQMQKAFGDKVRIHWRTDSKGVIWGACQLPDSEMIVDIAVLVAFFKGRVMTLSPYWHGEESSKELRVAYHFDVLGITITCTITLRGLRQVSSITPLLKSADWNEREMQETYHVQVVGHPNAQRLFLDDSINLTDDTMVPLSVAMSGASTQTLWERVMSATKERGRKDE